MLSLWEKFDPAHPQVCTKRPGAQVNALAINNLDVALTDEVLAELAIEDSLSTEFCQLSLNAISGTEEGECLTIRALVNNKVMLILVDSGSSHSFVGKSFLDKVGITAVPAPLQQVRVANGDILITDKRVSQLAWWANGHTLKTDMKVLDMSAYDAILGFDWLKSNSPMNCHWE